MAAAIGAGLPGAGAHRQHDRRHRRRHHRGRGDLARRHRVEPVGPRRRRRARRGDHPVHQEGVQPRPRRAHGRGGEDRPRIGVAAPGGAARRDPRPRPRHRPAQDDRHLHRGDPRGHRGAGRRDRRRGEGHPRQDAARAGRRHHGAGHRARRWWRAAARPRRPPAARDRHADRHRAEPARLRRHRLGSVARGVRGAQGRAVLVASRRADPAPASWLFSRRTGRSRFTLVVLRPADLGHPAGARPPRHGTGRPVCDDARLDARAGPRSSGDGVFDRSPTRWNGIFGYGRRRRRRTSSCGASSSRRRADQARGRAARGPGGRAQAGSWTSSSPPTSRGSPPGWCRVRSSSFDRTVEIDQGCGRRRPEGHGGRHRRRPRRQASSRPIRSRSVIVELITDPSFKRRLSCRRGARRSGIAHGDGPNSRPDRRRRQHRHPTSQVQQGRRRVHQRRSTSSAFPPDVPVGKVTKVADTVVGDEVPSRTSRSIRRRPGVAHATSRSSCRDADVIHRPERRVARASSCACVLAGVGLFARLSVGRRPRPTS